MGMDWFGGGSRNKSSSATTVNTETTTVSDSRNSGVFGEMQGAANYEGMEIGKTIASYLDFSQETEVGDVGLTGQDAVDLAAVIAQTNIEQGITGREMFTRLSDNLSEREANISGQIDSAERVALGMTNAVSEFGGEFFDSSLRSQQNANALTESTINAGFTFGKDAFDMVERAGSRVLDTYQTGGSDMLRSGERFGADVTARAVEFSSYMVDSGERTAKVGENVFVNLLNAGKSIVSDAARAAGLSAETAVVAQKNILTSGRTEASLLAEGVGDMSKWLPIAVAVIGILPFLLKKER